MERLDLIGTALGSGFVTFIFSKILGKKKEDIEIALKYQEFYQNHIDDLKNEIEELSNKVEVLIEQDKSNADTIAKQEKNLKRWENYCEELKQGIKDREKTNALLQKEIDLLKG